MFSIDAASDSLYRNVSESVGVQAFVAPITLNGNSVNFAPNFGFHIPQTVRTSTNTSPAAVLDLRLLKINGLTRLYRLNLVSGALTDLGTVGDGLTEVSGMVAGSNSVN